MKKVSCAVLFSGAGSTTRALLDYTTQNPSSHFRIDLLVTNKARAPGIALAEDYATELLVLPDKAMTSSAWGSLLDRRLAVYKPDIVILAGFMRILDEQLVTKWQRKIINIHPSLLPKYRGLNTHQRAIEAGDTEHGFSVHWVTPELDAGPIIAQHKIAIDPSDSPESLKEKVQQQERLHYPQIIDKIAKGIDQRKIAIDHPVRFVRTVQRKSATARTAVLPTGYRRNSQGDNPAIGKHAEQPIATRPI